MIERLIAALWDAGDLDCRDLADVLWLAHRLSPRPQADAPEQPSIPAATEPRPVSTIPVVSGDREPPQPIGGLGPDEPASELMFARRTAGEGGVGGVELRLPSSYALPGRLEIGRALRPLKQYRRSRRTEVFDTDATIDHFCATGLLFPITVPARERWFQEVALVVDASPTMVVWEETIDALGELLDHHPAFARVSRWTLVGDREGVQLESPGGLRQDVSTLIEFDARRLIFVLTDCVGGMWRGETAWAALREWGRFTPVVLAQTLPPRLWPATALGAADVVMTAHRRGEPNRQLQLRLPWWFQGQDASDSIPVITLDERRLGCWARMVMGDEGVEVAGVLTDPRLRRRAEPDEPIRDPRRRVVTFRTTVSERAARLATLLSAVEVSLPVARLILDRLIPDGRQVDLAEVLASGLLSQAESGYTFASGVREVLQESLTTSDTVDVWRTVAPYLEAATGERAPFSALIDAAGVPGGEVPDSALGRIAADLARRLGSTAPVPAARPPERSPLRSPEATTTTSEPEPYVAPAPETTSAVPPPPAGSVTAVAVVELEGRQVIVSAGAETLRLWDLPSGEPIGAPIVRSEGWLNAVAVGTIREQPAAVTASAEGFIGICYLATGEVLSVKIGVSRPLTALALANVNGETIALVGDAAGGITRWHPDGSWDPASAFGHGPITAIALTDLFKDQVAVYATPDGAVGVWNMTTGLRRDLPRTHPAAVTALAAGDFNGRVHAVAGDLDGLLQVWDLTDAVTLGQPVRAHTGRVTALVSHPIVPDTKWRTPDVVSAGSDGSIRLWEMQTGLVGTPARSIQTAPVTSIAYGTVGDHTVVVAGCSDGTITAWDALSGSPLVGPLVHGAVPTGTPVEVGDHAVVIGISRYGHGEIRDLPDVESDVRAFAAWLTEPAGGAIPPNQVTRIVGEVTQQSVISAFTGLLAEARSRSGSVGRRMYLYITGHGAVDSEGELSVLTSDASSIAPMNVPVRRIADYLERSGLFEEIVLIADAGRPAADLRVPATTLPWNLPSAPARPARLFYVLSRSGLSDRLGEPPSVFTRVLLEALSGGVTTSNDVSRYVSQRLPELLPPGELIRQTPEVSSSGGPITFGHDVEPRRREPATGRLPRRRERAERCCVVTVHGIGFQQPPRDGRPGYADALHEHLRGPLGDLLGDDPERFTGGGPAYVSSEWDGSRSQGLARLDPDRPLTAGGQIAHVALVYAPSEPLSRGEEREIRPGSERVRSAIRDSWRSGSQASPQEDLPADLEALQDDIVAYVSRDDLRERVGGFVDAALRALLNRDDIGQVVVNAHSQGTIVCYDVLRRLPFRAWIAEGDRRADALRSFVTAGSPLRKLIMMFSWDPDVGELGALDLHWTNFVDPNDPVGDPLNPPVSWRPGEPWDEPPEPDAGLLVAGDPSGAVRHVPIADAVVDNISSSSGGGLQAHNYWNNISQVIPALAALASSGLRVGDKK